MMKENEDGGVHLVGSVDCGGRTPFCAAARGAVCGGVKEKKKVCLVREKFAKKLL